MTIPALPDQGNTNWYSWAQGLDSAVRANKSSLVGKLNITESPPSLPQYWQAGDSDWTAAFGRMFTAGKSSAYVPPSSTPYDISAGLTMPQTMNLVLDDGAQIRATSLINGPMLTVGNLTSKWTDKHVRGGTWECNSLAANGLFLRYFLNVALSDLNVRNATADSIILGDPATGVGSNEVRCVGVKVDRSPGGSVPSNSVGLWFRNTNDSHLNNCIVVGADISFKNNGSGNRVVQCHGWGWTDRIPSVIFEENGYDTDYIGCKADSPSVYGFSMKSLGWRILGGEVFNGDLGLDGVITGIHTAQSSPTASIIGVAFNGAPTKHIGIDYDGPVPNLYLTAIGCTAFNCNTQYISNKEITRSIRSSGPVQVQGNNGGAFLFSGNGDPDTYVPASSGDLYIRKDLPTSPGCRIYICTGGSSWTGIL